MSKRALSPAALIICVGKERFSVRGTRVPITLKEQFLVSGTPTTVGLLSHRSQLMEQEGPLVTRLRQAGAIVLGKTNVSQLLLSLSGSCENPVYGRTNNPWNLARTPGGSSGGEAAIIAAGGSPLGL